MVVQVIPCHAVGPLRLYQGSNGDFAVAMPTDAETCVRRAGHSHRFIIIVAIVDKLVSGLLTPPILGSTIAF